MLQKALCVTRVHFVCQSVSLVSTFNVRQTSSHMQSEKYVVYFFLVLYRNLTNMLSHSIIRAEKSRRSVCILSLDINIRMLFNIEL